MAAPDFTTRRALRGLTGVGAQSSTAVISRVPAESAERILSEKVLTNPDVCMARLSMQHSGSATLQLSNPEETRTSQVLRVVS